MRYKEINVSEKDAYVSNFWDNLADLEKYKQDWILFKSEVFFEVFTQADFSLDSHKGMVAGKNNPGRCLIFQQMDIERKTYYRLISAMANKDKCFEFQNASPQKILIFK